MDEDRNEKTFWETPVIQDLGIQETGSGSFPQNIEEAGYYPYTSNPF